jgi:hypothetical protein
MSELQAYVLLAHNNDIDGPTEWSVFVGTTAKRDAIFVGERWSERWPYVAIRPVGDITQAWTNNQPAELVEWRKA